MEFSRAALVLGFATVCALATAPPAPAVPVQSCGNSTGILPLNDLGTGTYQGFQGGLYPGGANVPPPAHLAAALALAGGIVPRDGLGAPDAALGLIGLVSIGMSNTTHEYAVFERQADADPTRHARLVFLTCSQGGQDAIILANPNAPYWTLVQQRVAAAGLTNAQVQVVWLKEALAEDPPGFPATAVTLQNALGDIARNLHDLFPNLRLCYVSSRTYGGYNGVHPEPISFETGFSVKWLIEDQIQGDPLLNWDPHLGPVEAPLLLWGPYLWADGDVPRSDGLIWCPTDFENDGIHPAPPGEAKVGNLLRAFFAADPTAQPWFLSAGGAPAAVVDAGADAYVLAAQPNANFGTAATLRVAGQPQIARAYLKFDLRGVPRPVLHAKLSLRNPENALADAALGVRRAADTSWGENTITFNNAPAPSGGTRIIPQLTRDGNRALSVTEWVNGDADGLITLVLVAAASNTPATLVHSREGGWAPQLVLVPR